MEIILVRADINDAEHIYKMQKEAFSELLIKYKDYETSPANEPLSRTVERLNLKSTYYYLIDVDGEIAGAIRICDSKNSDEPKRISPLFVLPKFRNKGVAEKAILIAEEIHGQDNWMLETILEEKGNCHLYEKMGYKLSGERRVVNDKMTLVIYRK